MLNVGLHKLPLQRGQVNFHELGSQKLPSQKHITIYCKLCTAGDAEHFKNMSLDTTLASPKYTYASNIQDVPKASKRAPVRDSRSRVDREQRRGAARGRRTRDQKVMKSPRLRNRKTTV